MIRRRRLALLLGVVVVALAIVIALASGGGGEPDGPRRLAPGRGSTDTTADPLAYDGDEQQQFEQRAAAGLAHVLYAKSPGGAVATARRVAALRPMIDDVAARAHQDADTLEGIVFLESAGRPDARASNDLRGAVGLTQILAHTATDLLGLKVDVAASERLTRRIDRGGPAARVKRWEAQRRAVDERFDPRKALEATTRYLELAKGHLGRDDLAVVSYHMGIGNLQGALGAYGDDDIPYAQLFFDSTPLRHAQAWSKLAGLGDDSSTYLWRVRAAEDIMRTFRDDPERLAAQAALQDWPSAEHALHPPGTTPRFSDAAALRTGEQVLLDRRYLLGTHVRLSPALARRPEGERALRPPAAALLRYLGRGVAEVDGGRGDLTVTAASRSVAGESGSGAADVETPPSEHTTGYAFDISRTYASRAQAGAFQFWLDRLTALHLVAWVRRPDSIHIAVGPDAGGLVAAERAS
ncbi:MAG TPA: hypothetical protein VFT50_14650 [Baekduia sp.]|nr:hypothetical protein [Baekduia sp.]